MRTPSRKFLVALLAIVAVASLAAWWMRPADDDSVDPGMACHVGIYRLDDGRVVDIAPLTGDGLRWRTMDGRTGRLQRDEAGRWTGTAGWSERRDATEVQLGSCERPAMTFEGHRGQRLSFSTIDTRFRGHGEALAGRLVMPPGHGPVPIAVLVHGSEAYSARTFNFFQRLLPANGIGVFVYDKRGTGASTGRYSQDFHLLADDAVAALKEARRLAGARAGRVGFSGGSQAGWIIPLAANRSDADYAAVAYGLADTPLAEDRDQVRLDLIAAGYGPDVLAKAREVTDATGAVMVARFKGGYDRLEAVKARYSHEPWWKDMRGEYTGELVRYPPIALRLVGPWRDEGTSWEHEPMPVLRSMKQPLLWIIAGADREAPPDETRRRLLAVARDKANATVVEFPGTDHGILEFETAPDGTRVETRVADGYFPMLVDWIGTGRLGEGPYGSALVLAPARSDPDTH